MAKVGMTGGAILIAMIVLAGAGGQQGETEAPCAVPESRETAPRHEEPPGATQEEPLPPELAEWSQVLKEEKRALDMLRQVDRMQQALGEWDLEIARELTRMGDQAAAQTKVEDARKRFRVVRRAYEEFLSRYPNNARANTYYGELLYDRFGDHARAIQCWKLAEQLDRKLSLPLNDLAIHYCHYGQPDLGLKYFERAIELDPDNPDYLFNGAQFYLTLGPHVKRMHKWDNDRVYKEAMKFSKRAVELRPNDYELWEDYAVNFFAAENFGVEADWKQAADVWRQARAAAKRPDHVFFTWINEARAAIRAKDEARAASCLEEALKLQPDSEVTKQLLAEVRERSS